jgi:glycerol dehydrogenase
MITTTVFPGRYIQGYDAAKYLWEEMERFGRHGFFIGSPTVHARILPSLLEDIPSSLKITTEKFGGECSDEEIARERQIAEKTGCDVIIGMGGGKTLDTAKAVAYYLKKPVIIVPTIASTDAPCSAVAVVHKPTGEMQGPLSLNHNPDVVIADTHIIARAPVRYLVAGMGDALSKRFEADSCRRKKAPNMTNTGHMGSMTAYALGDLCYQTLVRDGLAAVNACRQQEATPELEHIVEANTLLSGLAFENSGLAAAHAIEIAFSFSPATHRNLHGEIVGFCTLVSLFLTGKDPGLIDEVYSFSRSIGLPTTLADIGLAGITGDELEQTAKLVCSPGGLIYHEPIEVTEKAVVAAIRAADSEGKHGQEN